MNSSKFEYLISAFSDQIKLIEKSIEQDKDFRQLCYDYEKLGETIKYLKNLMNLPTEQIEKQIASYEELFSELEQEINMHLENEK